MTPRDMEKVKLIGILCIILILVACRKDNHVKRSIPCIQSNFEELVLAFHPFTNTSLNDVSGNDHHWTNSTTAVPTTDRHGNADCAYEFDNLPVSNEFLTNPSASFLDSLNEFSVSVWYQPKDTSRNAGDFESLINRDLGPGCPDRNGQWSIGLYDCRKAVFGRTNSVWDIDITNFDCQDEIGIRTDHWTHLVATFKQNGNEMALYRDGVLQEFDTGDGICGTGTPIYQDIGDLFLGKDYTGKIDDVILFDRSLSQQEVITLFNMDPCCGS